MLHEKIPATAEFQDPKEARHYDHVTFTPITKHFMLYCRLIYMLSMLYVRLMIKVKVGIPETLKVGWYPHKITGSSHLELYYKGLLYCGVCRKQNFSKRTTINELILQIFFLKTKIEEELVSVTGKKFQIFGPR